MHLRVQTVGFPGVVQADFQGRCDITTAALARCARPSTPRMHSGGEQRGLVHLCAGKRLGHVVCCCSPRWVRSHADVGRVYRQLESLVGLFRKALGEASGAGARSSKQRSSRSSPTKELCGFGSQREVVLLGSAARLGRTCQGVASRSHEHCRSRPRRGTKEL